MLIPVAITSIAVALLSAFSYFPYQKHLKLHGAIVHLATQGPDLLNLEHCKPLSTRLPNQPAGPTEPSFCEDVVLDKRTGVAYLSCDPTRLAWDARARLYEDGSDKLAEQQGTPGIWAWDTSRPNLPRKLYISSPPPEWPLKPPADLQSTFHPLGIAVTASNPYYVQEPKEGEDARPEPPANLVLVTNKPYADKPGVVDIFVHDLDKVGGKDHTTLRWIKRVQGKALLGAQFNWDEHLNVDPFRIAVFEEQYGERIPRDYLEPKHVKDNPDNLEGFKNDHAAAQASKLIRIPSFFVTSFPERTADKAVAERSDVFASMIDPILSVLSSKHSRAGDKVSNKVFVHHSSINSTMAIRLDGSNPEQRVGFPQLLQVWNGGGEAAGSNSSALGLFLPTISSDKAGIQEWEQHWVRGVSGGLRDHRLRMTQTTPDGQVNNVLKVYKTYTPSFVNFYNIDLDTPIRAIVVDEHGRVWTAGNPSTRAAEKWIASQRDDHRRRLGLSASSEALSSSDSPPRPAGKIDQTTYLFRHFGNVVAHPWETEKLKAKREQGIWLRKEFHTFNVFRSPQETKAEVEGRSVDDLKQRGFLPTVPTGLAIDIHKKLLYVTGAYEERGIAVCSLPEDRIEA